MVPIVRAIDVGYGVTKYVTTADPQPIKCAHFPSDAPLADNHQSFDVLGAKRRTLVIPIDELLYEVGPDVHLAAETFTSKHMHDGYCDTAEYLAFVRAALRFMKVDHVDLLVPPPPVPRH